MNLFFVYDTSYCKADEDDPKDAVIYFFPVQTSESERYLVCCQLVGVAKFFRTTFSTPSVIGLDEGKFAFYWSGKYLLVLGANSDIQSNVLKDQLSFLSEIFCFYHGSINNVLKSSKNCREEFLAKLELAWSRYITMSQCFGNVLQFSMNALPLTAFKKSAGIVSKANRLLHMCQLSSSVLAGVIFYNSRVLASQLTPQLSNYLSLMSNYNASSPVSNIFPPARSLPPDVELKYVFLSPKAISMILKYNHSVVGSHIRVKFCNKVPHKSNSLPSYYDCISSGSEGDIDSGNGSESIQSFDAKFESTTLQRAVIPDERRAWKNKRFCCTGHWRIFQRKMLISRNQSCLKFIYEARPVVNRINLIETEDSGIHPMTEWYKNTCYGQEPNCYSQGRNVLCNSHANLQTSSFVSESKSEHSNFTNASDLEFNCLLCRDRIMCVNPLSLKHWNSEMDLMYPSLETPKLSCLLEKRGRGVSKVQVLKCRSHSETLFKTRRQVLHRKHSHPSGTLHPNERHHNSLLDSCKMYANIDRNELQKHVLYVQRYGGCTLLLLLNKGYDEKIITYLWNCGFSILRDIEFNVEKIATDNCYDLETSFNIMLYNNSQKVLKEYPHYPSVMLTEKRTRESIQSIQADFQTDPNIHMFNVLSGNRSIYASHKDPYSAFYVQPEINSRKLDALYSLSKRAVRRLQKYFKVSL